LQFSRKLGCGVYTKSPDSHPKQERLGSSNMAALRSRREPALHRRGLVGSSGGRSLPPLQTMYQLPSQRLPVISRPTRSLRILGPSEWASLFTRIKAKLIAARPSPLYAAAASASGLADLVDAQVSNTTRFPKECRLESVPAPTCVRTAHFCRSDDLSRKRSLSPLGPKWGELRLSGLEL